MANIKTYNSPQKTAEALANYLKEAINAGNTYHLAVSGGSTPKMLFEALVEISEQIDWYKLQLYWVDERCVAPTHEESNYLMTYDSLLKNVPLAEAHIHRMKGELAPDDMLKDYQSIIDTLPKATELPQFDLIILGMGDDGHTASIFPPEKELITQATDLAIGTNPYSGQKRLTLTGRTIKNSKAVFFHVTGKNKAKVVSEIMGKNDDFETYPAYYFNDEETVWYTDEDAVSHLE